MSELPLSRKRSSKAALLPRNVIEEPPTKKAAILECEPKDVPVPAPDLAASVENKKDVSAIFVEASKQDVVHVPAPDVAAPVEDKKDASSIIFDESKEVVVPVPAPDSAASAGNKKDASAAVLDASCLDEITPKLKKWTKDAYADVLARQNVCVQYQRCGQEWQVALALPPVDPKVYVTEQKFVLARGYSHGLSTFRLTNPRVLGAGAFGIVVQGELDGKTGVMPLISCAPLTPVSNVVVTRRALHLCMHMITTTPVMPSHAVFDPQLH